MPGPLARVDDPWGIAWQARMLTRRLEAARPAVPDSAWIGLHREDLRERRDETLPVLCSRLQIPREDRLVRRMQLLNEQPAGATSPPETSKWRSENATEVRGLLPRIAAAAPARGYRVDPDRGDFEIRRREAAPPPVGAA